MPAIIAWVNIFLLSFQYSTAFAALPQKHPVEPQLFEKFVLYTKFAAAAIPPNGCNSPPNGAVVIGNINNNATNTQARVFRDDSLKQIIFGIPGSHKGDSATNHNITLVPYSPTGVSCEACKVHGGYFKAWTSILHTARGILDNALHNHPNYKIVITGHSLGGALSTLAYTGLKALGYPVVAAYTQGSPRVGNEAYAKYIERQSGASNTAIGNFYRITHYRDSVPGFPQRDKGYRHSETEFWEAGINVQNAKTTYRCYGQESLQCNRGQMPKSMMYHGLYSNVHFGTPQQQCNGDSESS